MKIKKDKKELGYRKYNQHNYGPLNLEGYIDPNYDYIFADKNNPEDIFLKQSNGFDFCFAKEFPNFYEDHHYYEQYKNEHFKDYIQTKESVLMKRKKEVGLEVANRTYEVINGTNQSSPDSIDKMVVV